MAGTRKVLLSGDINGKFKSLFSRVASVNKTNGPFDLLLCTCCHLSELGETRLETSLAELDQYITGASKVPVPTYLLRGSGIGAGRIVERLEAPESQADIHYLGQAGLQTIKGLSIAYLDSGHTQDDVKAVEMEVGKAQGDVDFLLTCDWPSDVTKLVAPGAVPEGMDHSGSKVAADLALTVRPRYHIAGGKDVYFARVPYLNKDLGAGSHVTRFIGLAAVGNSAKQKSLHALGLQPAALMETATLQQEPQGTTPCPYVGQKRSLEGGIEEQPNWRWQSTKKQRKAGPGEGQDVVKDDRKSVYVSNVPYAADEDDIAKLFQLCGTVVDVRRGSSNGRPHGYCFVQFESIEAVERACELESLQLMGRELAVRSAGKRPEHAPTGDPVQGCWFCLSNSAADISLIVSIGEEMYVAMDKGPINSEHVLILPIEHRANSLEISQAAYIELERYLSALRSCFASKGKELLAFERFMNFRNKGGNHLQFNAISIPAAAAKAAKATFEAAAKANGITLKTVPGPTSGPEARAALREVVGTGEYFLAVLPDGSRLVHAFGSNQKHPMPFGREVAAQLAGVPHRADWRNCQGDKAQEEKLTATFKELFKTYDIMA